MEFKELFLILKKHLSDGSDVPSFFRDLVAMITKVTEAEWGTKKDPSSNLTNDETIRSYTKRGLPKRLAQTIVYRLTPDVLTRHINKRPIATRRLMADDLRAFDPTIEADNVGKMVTDWMVEIIQASAGLVQQDAIEQKKQQQLAADLKTRYGDYLLNEADDHCPFPGCGRKLTTALNGKVVHTYEVSLIDKNEAPRFDNLLAVCPLCNATYSLDDNKKLCKELQNVKAVLTAHNHSIQLIDGLSLEKGIAGVVKRIAALKGKDFDDAKYDPKELKDKLDPDDDWALYLTVKNYVMTYFVSINEIMINLDKRGVMDYEGLRDQMNAIYKKLKRANKTNVEIFNEITDKVRRATLQADVYCQIVVSYFVQRCDVFDAIAKQAVLV